MKLPDPLRTLLSDLIERRLWPVALILVVALVAVPVVLLGGSSAEDEAPLATSAVVTPTDDAGVTLTDAGRTAKSTGKARDPFGRPQAKTTTTTTPAASSTGGSGSGSGAGTDTDAGSGDTGGTSGGGGASTDLGDIGVVPVGSSGGTSAGDTGASSDKKKPASKDSWHVDLRFGKNGSKLQSRSDVPRLSPLPSQDDPFFVFLGVAADGKTAMFLVSSDADITGNATCKPTPANCERVEMKAGDTAYFDVTTPEGTVEQYELDLVRVSRKVSANAAVAQQSRTRESSAGREVLREAVATKQVDVSGLAYSSRLGLVIPAGAGDQNSALFGGYRVDLQFGAPNALVKRYNLARLTPLPSVENPSFVYLGVLGADRTALFLNPSEAAVSGDAVCEPSPEQCQRLKLAEGQSATLAAQAIDGSLAEYQLDVDAITPLQADSAEEATASRNRESKAGRVVLRRLVTEVGSLVGDLTFAPGKGVVEPAPAE
jgi:hypothetical protein